MVEPTAERLPILGILSIAMTPVAILFTLLGGWISEVLIDRPGSLSMTTLLPGVARGTSRVLLACAVEGVAAGVIALIIGERPRWPAAVGVVGVPLLVVLVVVLFAYFGR